MNLPIINIPLTFLNDNTHDNTHGYVNEFKRYQFTGGMTHLRYQISPKLLLYLVSNTGRGRLLLASVSGSYALFYQDL